MSYKSLLVHLDDSPSCATRLTVALDLAQRYGAHLIGIYLPRTATFGNAGDPTCDASRARAYSDFLFATERDGTPAEWRAPDSADRATATLHARHADLLVLGQSLADSAVEAHFVTDLLITAARPAIIVPREGEVTRVGDNVLIAWDGSREAARATSDALPLLKRARSVSLEFVTPRIGAPCSHDRAALIDAAAWLDLHGVRAAFDQSMRGLGSQTGTALLSRASALHADLIVAGAYAHSQLHERVLGGVTRTLLEAATLPLFMSH